MLRRAVVGVGLSALIAGCGSGNVLPKQPTITAARACLERHGMTSTVVPAAKLRPITLASDNVAGPIAELSVLHSAAPRTRLLITYFATAKTATAAERAVNPNAPAFRRAPAGALEVEQAADGKQRGRIVVIEFHADSANQSTLFAARYCATGVPIPKAQSATTSS